MNVLPISVIVPAFNREHTIERCVRSILIQDPGPREIVVVDDGSTDRTVEKVAAIPDSRIRIHPLSANRGAQVARNEGLHICTQPWITLLDSDDEWLPGKIAMQWRILEGHSFDESSVLHSDCLKEEEGLSRLWALPRTEGPGAYRSLLLRPAPMFQGLLVHRHLLESVGGFDERIGAYQEWETSIRLAKAGHFTHSRAPTFIYHVHMSPRISNAIMADLMGYQQVVEIHEAEIRRVHGDAGWYHHMARQTSFSVRHGLFDRAPEYVRRMGSRGRVLRWLLPESPAASLAWKGFRLALAVHIRLSPRLDRPQQKGARWTAKGKDSPESSPPTAA